MKNTDLHFKKFNFTHAETMQTNWYEILVNKLYEFWTPFSRKKYFRK